MKFKNLIKNSFDTFPNFDKDQIDISSITVYPFSEYNLEGVKIFFDSCKKAGALNNNVKIATVDPTIWLGDFLDKHFDKISYVTNKHVFNVLKIERGEIVNKRYNIKTIDFNNDEELDDFFNKSKFRTLVLFSIVKSVDLKTLKYSYKLRYSDITEGYEIRDKKINELFRPED